MQEYTILVEVKSMDQLVYNGYYYTLKALFSVLENSDCQRICLVSTQFQREVRFPRSEERLRDMVRSFLSEESHQSCDEEDGFSLRELGSADKREYDEQTRFFKTWGLI
jgi:hypothetical protein